MANFFALPPELLDQILILLTNPSDHLHLALTSRLALFYTLPHLYRIVNWKISGFETQEFKPCRLAVEFLRGRPELWDCVRSLRLSEKRTTEEGRQASVGGYTTGTANVGNATAAGGNSSGEAPLIRRPQRYADPWFESVHSATKLAWSTIPIFAHLSSLSLISISLPTNFYHIIHAISLSLRCLTLRAVRLTSRYPTSLGNPFDFLRIEELTFLQVVQGPYTSVAKIKSVLRLARSHTLRTLRVDRSIELGVDSFVAAGIPSSLHTLICDFRGPMVGTGSNQSRLNANLGHGPGAMAAFAALNHGAVPMAPGFAQFAQMHLQMAQAHAHGHAHFHRTRSRKPLIALFRFLHACQSVRELRMTDVGVVSEGTQNDNVVHVAGGVLGVQNILAFGMNANADGWQIVGNGLVAPPHGAQGLGAALLANGDLNPLVNNTSTPIRLFKSAFPNLTDVTGPLSHIRILIHGRVERPLRSITVSSNVDLDPFGCANSRNLTVGGSKGGVTYVKLEDIASALRAVRNAMIPLEAIRFTLRDWDKEVIYMLSEIASGLKEIKMTFSSGQTDDAFFMTLGNIIEFPNLESLHLFRLGHVMNKNYAYMDTTSKRQMQAEDERMMEDHREYLIIWERYMPKLKEVRLVEDVVWVKREEEGMQSGCGNANGVRGRGRRKKVPRWEKVTLTE